MSKTAQLSERVIVAIDPHKAPWTAAAVGASLQTLQTIRVSVSRAIDDCAGSLTSGRRSRGQSKVQQD